MTRKVFSGKHSSRVLIGSLKNSQGELINDIEDITEVLNNFFSSVFLNCGKLDESMYLKGTGVLNTVDFDKANVLKVIQSIKPNEAPGLDSIYRRVLKEGAEELIETLTTIFKTSMQTGIIP